MPYFHVCFPFPGESLRSDRIRHREELSADGVNYFSFPPGLESIVIILVAFPLRSGSVGGAAASRLPPLSIVDVVRLGAFFRYKYQVTSWNSMMNETGS